MYHWTWVIIYGARTTAVRVHNSTSFKCTKKNSLKLVLILLHRVKFIQKPLYCLSHWTNFKLNHFHPNNLPNKRYVLKPSRIAEFYFLNMRVQKDYKPLNRSLDKKFSPAECSWWCSASHTEKPRVWRCVFLQRSAVSWSDSEDCWCGSHRCKEEGRLQKVNNAENLTTVWIIFPKCQWNWIYANQLCYFWSEILI